jgi:transcriptional regulator with XRE-family HTH domain
LPETLGDRVCRLREDRGLSQVELAKAVQVGQAFISDIEVGRRNPSLPTLTRLAAALSTSVGALVDGTPEEVAS